MRILILGATGLLGHRLFIELSKHHEVWGTYRKSKPNFGDKKRWVWLHDGLDGLPVLDAFGGELDAIINCVAAIPQRGFDKPEMINANSLFPTYLSRLCKTHYKTRLIHFSTDGVFGSVLPPAWGNLYDENDVPDASDIYGMTKRLGEITDQKHVVTLRVCPIGRELATKHSFVEWALSQSGTIQGYKQALFSGITSHELARVINEYVLPHPELSGLYHVGGGVNSKYNVLMLLKAAYQLPIEIEPSQNGISRGLSTKKFQQATGYNPPSWETMIQEMAADNALYEGEHAHG
jgi:dTDP-4-dehydrorhamnose reductase